MACSRRPPALSHQRDRCREEVVRTRWNDVFGDLRGCRAGLSPCAAAHIQRRAAVTTALLGSIRAGTAVETLRGQLRDYVSQDMLDFIDSLVKIVDLPLQLVFAAFLGTHSSANYTPAGLAVSQTSPPLARPSCRRIAQQTPATFMAGAARPRSSSRSHVPLTWPAPRPRSTVSGRA